MKFIKYLLVASLSAALFACGGGDDNEYKEADIEVYKQYSGTWKGSVDGPMKGFITVYIRTYDGGSLKALITHPMGDYEQQSDDGKGEINGNNKVKFRAMGYNFEGGFDYYGERIEGTYKHVFSSEKSGIWFADKRTK